ncbi:MAG TPA: beta-propeller fold lactonase family protein, partial [Prevotella sp.]
MNIKRFSLLFGAVLCFSALHAQNNLHLLVGTYTDGTSKGIYSFSFDQQTGQTKALHSLAMRNPSYLTLSKNGRHIYAVSETNDANASVSA